MGGKSVIYPRGLLSDWRRKACQVLRIVPGVWPSLSAGGIAVSFITGTLGTRGVYQQGPRVRLIPWLHVRSCRSQPTSLLNSFHVVPVAFSILHSASSCPFFSACFTTLLHLLVLHEHRQSSIINGIAFSPCDSTMLSVLQRISFQIREVCTCLA